MDIRFATAEELARWDDLLVKNPDGGNVFSSYEIAKVKQFGGWKARYLLADDKLAITALEKSVKGIGKLWYLPKGPGINNFDDLMKLTTPLNAFAKTQGVFAVKIEPELAKNEKTNQALLAAGLVKVRPIQPNFSTVIIDLKPSTETIMKNFNQKGRHAINRAKRDGVITTRVPFNRDNALDMYNLLVETAKGKFHTRHFNYYYHFWQNFVDEGRGQLFFAHYNGELVATAFAVYLGEKGTYKDGASVRKKTTYGASHLLQWEVMNWLKERGVTSYDLCGAPPSDMINDETHPHYGIGRFKTSFNKQVTDYIGAYDIVVKPMKYKLWRKIGERAAVRLHSMRFREYWY